MPGLSGLDLQKELAKAGVAIPLIFTTGHGYIPMSVQAMKAGAVEFLTKPFRDPISPLFGRIRKPQAVGSIPAAGSTQTVPSCPVTP